MNEENTTTATPTTTQTPTSKIATAREKLTAARSSASNDRLNEVIDAVELLLDEAGV